MIKKQSLLALALGLITMASCSKWTDTEVKNPTPLVGAQKDDGYYARLRAYKASDHPKAFGWFGNWTGQGSSIQGSLAGLPDSVDFVSLWGKWNNLTEAHMADLKYAQEVKGIKALAVFIVQDIGSGGITPTITDAKREEYKQQGLDEAVHTSTWFREFWDFPEGSTTADSAKRLLAVEKMANMICDTIDKYGLDGFDIDYEPNFGHSGNVSGHHYLMLRFIETLGKRIGPKSGTGRLLVIDGEPQSIVSASGPYFDYFLVQAYNSSGDSDLDTRLGRTIKNFEGYLAPEEVAKKYIVTENFESHASSGGVNFTDRYGNRMMSLEGMARWTPKVNGKPVAKGGVGTYHMEYEYTIPGYGNVTYPYLRKAIQIMNPVITK